MDKEEQQKPLEEETVVNSSEEKIDVNSQADAQQEAEEKNEEVELAPENKIKELEDKLARTFAEMENQRRRYEKEKEDAFEYGGTSFAREALNLIDNLERSKKILENDEKLKNTEALNKTLEHLRYN
jgi:molecular chaperone GrpE